MIRILVLAFALVAGLADAQPGAIKRIGYFSAASAEVNAPRIAAFRQGMSELGWVDGKDYIVDARYAEASGANMQLAADVVASRPDVILTSSDAPIRALIKATKTIPIVFATASDPLALEAVKSLQRPGGNVTGLASLRGPLAAKSVQLLKEAFPRVAHVAVVFQAENPASVAHAKEMVAAAERLGIRVSRVSISRAEDITAAIAGAASAGCQAYAVADGFILVTHHKRVTQAINNSKLPAIYIRTEFVEAGGLMSYAASTFENFRRAATYVDKILKGANAGDLPIEQASKFELTVNMRTAKATAIAVPTSLLVRADKVIQ